MLPIPAVPWDALSGLDFNQAISSLGQQGDRLKIPHDIVLQRIDRTVDDVGTPITVHQRMPVGRRTRDPAGSNAAGCAAYILDDDGLAKRHAHLFSQDTTDGVARPAGGERHHNGDRPRGVALGKRN